MDSLNREETLKLLASMGVELPPQTKLSDEALEERLRKCVRSIQDINTLFPSRPAPLSSYSAWPTKGRHAMSVLEGIRRVNIGEALQIAKARESGLSVEAEVYVNPFGDLRQTVMALGRSWDEGVRCCIVQDPVADVPAIYLRMLEVRKIDSKTPMILLLYHPISDRNSGPGAEWIAEKVRTLPKINAQGEVKIMRINATPLEQKLLLRILNFNAKYVPSEYKADKTTAESPFTTSFIIPVAPLSFKELGELNQDTGCVVCGEKRTKTCSQCQSVSYCSPECQKEDWPAHKNRCKSIKGGTWRTIRIYNCVPGTEGLYTTMINRYGSVNSLQNAAKDVKPNDNSTPQPNIHGSKVFIVKMQFANTLGSPTGPMPKNMLIYDRKRSFEVYFVENGENRELFGEFVREMRHPERGFPRAVKMYRWARWVSDWELSVCLDRVPEENIVW
ncbi:hypothetical protein K474DRAFT_1677252 [Panus rudis PR-1116 ss-1]|nr:hypothetical protein K474DRAFT_1677252 [Panus rudis PR-1116 ss-1]